MIMLEMLTSRRLRFQAEINKLNAAQRQMHTDLTIPIDRIERIATQLTAALAQRDAIIDDITRITETINRMTIQ
jgi:hypothetical protein